VKRYKALFIALFIAFFTSFLSANSLLVQSNVAMFSLRQKPSVHMLPIDSNFRTC